MSDIKCVVCGEPYDAYGLNHGDMFAWETDLFRKGAGCPSCEGRKPEVAWEPQTLEDVENGDEDPCDRIFAYQDSISGNVPKWEPPEPEVLWTCDGCGVQVVRDLANQVYDGKEKSPAELMYVLPSGAKGKQYYFPHPYDDGNPQETPAHTFLGGQKVCEFCLGHCYECGEPVSSHVEFADVYDDGATLPVEGKCYNEYCTDCASKLFEQE